jgi:hypothetical protein
LTRPAEGALAGDRLLDAIPSHPSTGKVAYWRAFKRSSGCDAKKLPLTW